MSLKLCCSIDLYAVKIFVFLICAIIIKGKNGW